MAASAWPPPPPPGCAPSAWIAGCRSPLEDIPEADAILLSGANPAETMPPIMQYFEAQKARGGKLIVADPRRTATAKTADLHLQLVPGSDGALACGMLHIAIADRLIDLDFIAARTTGFESVRQAVATFWPDRTERMTGVPARLLTQAVHMLAEAPAAMALSARGAEQQSQGVGNTLALINLMLALGKAGRPGCGWGCLTGQGNGQGGREHGQKADQLPGYRRLDDPAHRAHVAAVWDVDPASLPAPGMSAMELLDSLGQPRRGAGAAGDGLQRRRLGTARRCGGRTPGRAGSAGGRRCLPVGDRRLGRCRAADRPMGRGGRHHDQSGGPRAAPPPRPPAAAGGLDRRADPARLGRAAGPGRALHRRPARSVRRAAPRQRRRRRRLCRHHLAAHRGRGRRVLAVPRRGACRQPKAVPRPLRHTGRPRALSTSCARCRRPRRPTGSIPTC